MSVFCLHLVNKTKVLPMIVATATVHTPMRRMVYGIILLHDMKGDGGDPEEHVADLIIKQQVP